MSLVEAVESGVSKECLQPLPYSRNLQKETFFPYHLQLLLCPIPP